MTAARSLVRAFDLNALPEDELVSLCRRGDEGAVRALIQRHNQRLFRMARGILRNEHEAEDAVQEAYVRAFTSLETFRGHSAFSTWLTRILINEALGRVRRRRAAAELEQAEAVTTRDQFVEFLQAFHSDATMSRSGWENADLERFLLDQPQHLLVNLVALLVVEGRGPVDH